MPRPACLALVLAYVLYPLSMALPRLLGAVIGQGAELPPRNWIDAAWLFLALAALLAAWREPGPDAGRSIPPAGPGQAASPPRPPAAPVRAASALRPAAPAPAEDGRRRPRPDAPAAPPILPGRFGPAGPADSADPVGSAGSVGPAGSVDSVDSVAPAGPFDPVGPTGPIGLAGWTGLTGLALLVRFGPLLFASPADLAWAPLLMELKPFFYLAVTAALLLREEAPPPGAFVAGGLALALLLLADLLLSSLAAGDLVRPFGSGEVNYDACLLAISLVFALRAARTRPAVVAVLILGLGASLSRTGLAAGAMAALFARGGPLWRLGLAGILAAGIVGSVAARGVSVESAEDLDRVQMWTLALELWRERPAALLTGFAPGRALPVEPPDELAGLFQTQAEDWGADGIFAFNFHSFWPRAALTWGLFPPLLLALAPPLRAWRAGRIAFLALCLTAWIMGSSMGLFYLGNTAPPLLLALRRTAAPPRGQGGAQGDGPPDPRTAPP